MSSVDRAGAFLTDVDRFPWKNRSEFCIVRATHKFKSLGFVCSPSLACCLFSHGVILTCARVSLALLSLRKNKGTTLSLWVVRSDGQTEAHT